MDADILISLSAFGQAEVRRHGQLWFARLAHAAGADGVEVRGELLNHPESEVRAIAGAAADSGLGVVYSSPEPLWNDDGGLHAAALERALVAAERLGAPRLKMSIGGYGAASRDSFAALATQRRGRAVELLIENDQTETAGTLPALRSFFADAHEAGLTLPMTFDMGNWHWLGECPLRAADALGAQVGYVHCKGVQRERQRWIAVPLAESSAPWRSVLHSLPADVPWAIEYPLAGDDLLDVTRTHVRQLRALRAGFGAAA
ncbi:MAG: TIM barrel protein [Proteobacteria bacterium]|nr:TIM barrel protein [Pseudomonadota bacterium]